MQSAIVKAEDISLDDQKKMDVSDDTEFEVERIVAVRGEGRTTKFNLKYKVESMNFNLSMAPCLNYGSCTLLQITFKCISTTSFLRRFKLYPILLMFRFASTYAKLSSSFPTWPSLPFFLLNIPFLGFFPSPCSHH